MIFFQFFTERWLAATQGMTMQQEAAYLRLVVWCYVNESELPLDMDECYRIARCSNRDDKDAVDWVTVRKFVRTSTGQIQDKTAIEVDKFRRGQPVRENRRVVDAERKRKSRAEQSRLFADARQKGLNPKAGSTLNELRALLGMAQVYPIASAPSGETGGRTRPVRPTVYEPSTIEHSPDASGSRSADVLKAENRLAGGPLDPVEAAPQADPERVGAAVRALRGGGLQGINAGHPLLHALVAAGATADALTFAAAHAVARGKGFAYALAMVQGQMQDAAQAQANGLAKPVERNRVSEWAPGLEVKP